MGATTLTVINAIIYLQFCEILGFFRDTIDIFARLGGCAEYDSLTKISRPTRCPVTSVTKRLRQSRGSVLAFGTQDRGFKPGRSRRIFQGEKILSTPSFGGEVKP